MKISDIPEKETVIEDIPNILEDMAGEPGKSEFYRVMYVCSCVLGSILLFCVGFIAGQVFYYAAWYIRFILTLFL